MVRVKICGITSPADAITVASNGADAIGIVFYEKSPRNVDIATAKAICDAIPPFVTTVALFMDAEQTKVAEVLQAVPFDLLQFHGAESPEYCTQFSRPYIKAVPMKGGQDFYSYAEAHPQAKGFLVDSHAPGEAGGTGEAFDWTQVPVDYGKPIILAGGLYPQNVAQAIQTADVYAVDVSSGVEASPGEKDKQKIQHFMQEVRRVERNP